jgi:hypothetical protein
MKTFLRGLAEVVVPVFKSMKAGEMKTGPAMTSCGVMRVSICFEREVLWRAAKHGPGSQE